MPVIERLRQQAAEVRGWLIERPRLQKRIILILSDVAMLTGVLCCAVWLRRLSLEETTSVGIALMVLAPVITVGVFASLGLYRLVTRYIGHRGNVRIAAGVLLATLVWSLLVFMSGQQGVPRSAIVLFALFGTAAIAASRHFAAYLLKSAGVPLPVLPDEGPRKNVLIYGAGARGVRLLDAVRGVPDRHVVGFVDADSSVWGQYVSGVKVYRPEKLVALLEKRDVKEVLLALGESQREERRRVIDDLKGQPVVVKVLPGLEDIASGRISVSDLRAVDVDDLLGRDPVPPKRELLERTIRGRSILVTGAGGSVGSELVRQIVRLAPRRLVLFDISEFALYQIDLQVREMLSGMGNGLKPPVVHAVLGSVLDARVVMQTLVEYGIETVFHAAAYKHVPIVEANAVVGLENNVFGTAVLAECAQNAGVERVVLISTDKAVRPTNIMGASKRIAELVLQARAADPACRTIFTMVRFGNVLDSSGSVVGLFRRQIRAGGPVTVTHPQVTRYFMSIPEAAGLVLQAGAMATGGEVFVLEMGEPVRIDDLARLMIRLTGLEVKTPERPNGDIAITYTGLRPGEKLFEELLIGAATEATEHPRILRSGEPFLGLAELNNELAVLRAAMDLRDRAAIEAVLMRTVEGFKPQPASGPAAIAVLATSAPSRMLH